MKNRIDLSRGVVTVLIETDRPLPPDAFRVLGYLAGQVERYALELDQALALVEAEVVEEAAA